MYDQSKAVAEAFINDQPTIPINSTVFVINDSGSFGPGLYAAGETLPVLFEDVNGLFLRLATSALNTIITKHIVATKWALLKHRYYDTGYITVLVDENGVSCAYRLYKPQQG